MISTVGTTDILININTLYVYVLQVPDVNLYIKSEYITDSKTTVANIIFPKRSCPS